MRGTHDQLKVFGVVAENGSITRAAERLHLTPPTLSIQLRQLAEGLGVTLYEIVGRQLRLTGAGEDVLHSARNLEAELRALDQRLAARGGVERGRLRVAAVSTGEYLFPSMLGRFRQRHPGIEASLQIVPRDALIRRIDQGLDDWYLMTRPPADRGLLIERVAINPLVMIAAPDHPWTRRKRIDFRAVSEERFVVRESGSGTRLWTEEWLGRFGAELKPALELGSNEAIKQAVRAGHGLAVISLHAVRLELEAGLLEMLRVPHFPAPVWWHRVQRPGAAVSPAARAFGSQLDAELPRLDGALQTLLKQHHQSWSTAE